MSLADKRMTSFQQTLNRRQKQLSALKLLVVDDDHSILTLLETALLALENCQVSTASSFEAALKLINSAEKPFDCFFIDIQMPGKNGIELLREIRSRPDHDVATVIMLTAMCERRYVDTAFLEGATDYISKPFNLLDLQLRLQAVQDVVRNRKKTQRKRTVVARHQQEVQCNFEDPFNIHNMPRHLGYLEFDNYIGQLSRGRLFNSKTIAVMLQDASFSFEVSPSKDFPQAVICLARSLSTCLEKQDCIFSYRGRGLFSIAVHGWKPINSLIKTEILNQIFTSELKRCDLPYESALIGKSFSLRSLSKSGAFSAIKMAINSVEALQLESLKNAESCHLGLDDFGRDQRNHMRKRAYEKVLIEMFRDETYLGKW